jgi:biotin carboxylase
VGKLMLLLELVSFHFWAERSTRTRSALTDCTHQQKALLQSALGSVQSAREGQLAAQQAIYVQVMIDRSAMAAEAGMPTCNAQTSHIKTIAVVDADVTGVEDMHAVISTEEYCSESSW